MKNFKNRQNEFVTKENIGERGFFISRSVAVVGIIIAKMDNKLFALVNKRGIGAADNIGKFNACCGYMDWSETGSEAITREIYEESGVDIDVIKSTKKILYNFTEQPFYVNTDPNENRQNISLSYGLLFETDNLPETSSCYSEHDEIEEIKWMDINDINKYDFAFGHDKRILSFLEIIQF